MTALPNCLEFPGHIVGKEMEAEQADSCIEENSGESRQIKGTDAHRRECGRERRAQRSM